MDKKQINKTAFGNYLVFFIGSVILCMIFGCLQADQTAPGKQRDLTYVYDADALNQVKHKIAMDPQVEPANTRLLAWTATGDDAKKGKAALYDVRYFTQTRLTELGLTAQKAFKDRWDDAKGLSNEKFPAEAGALEQQILSRLDSREQYYFAMKVLDEVGNASDMSNIVGPSQIRTVALPINPVVGQVHGFGSTLSWLGSFNGDSSPDIIVGSPQEGKAYLYFGRDASKLMKKQNNPHGIMIHKVLANLTPDATLAGNTAEGFAENVAGIGSYRGKSEHNDLAVGAPTHQLNGGAIAGAVYLFYGMDYNGDVINSASADVIMEGEADGDGFGQVSAQAANFNGDSYFDLVVGAPGAGKVYIFMGRSGGLDKGTYSAGTADVIISGDPAEGFGSVLEAIGDVNGDGHPDLAIAAPLAAHPDLSQATGAVYIFYGADAGVIDFNDARNNPVRLDLTAADHADVVLRGMVQNGGFGGAMLRGNDLQGRVSEDPSGDLVVSAPGAGQVFIFYGGSGTLLSLPSEYDSDIRNVLITGSPADGFGQAITGGADLDKDNVDDLVIAAPNASAGSGKLYIYYGPINPAAADEVISPGIINATYGQALSLGEDFSQDNYPDLLIGAPGAGFCHLDF